MIEKVHFLKAVVVFALLLATAVATLSVAEMNGLGSAYAQEPAEKIIKDDATGGDCTSIGRWNHTTKTCRLTTDLSLRTFGNAIEIDSDGITLNGNGHTITGTDYPPDKDDTDCCVGVSAYLRTGVTIINLNVNNFSAGIRLGSCDDCTVARNNVSNNHGDGIDFWRASNSTFILNTANSNGLNGISLDVYSNNNALVFNTANLNRNVGDFDASNEYPTARIGNTYIRNICSDNVSGGSLTVFSQGIVIGPSLWGSLCSHQVGHQRS